MTHTKYGFVWRARKATAELSLHGVHALLVLQKSAIMLLL